MCWAMYTICTNRFRDVLKTIFLRQSRTAIARCTQRLSAVPVCRLKYKSARKKCTRWQNTALRRIGSIRSTCKRAAARRRMRGFGSCWRHSRIQKLRTLSNTSRLICLRMKCLSLRRAATPSACRSVLHRLTLPMAFIPPSATA